MKYIAMGRALPERADINFSEVTWRSSDEMSISVRCEASQISVTINDVRVDGHVSAFITAEHIASTIVSCLGFELATSYSVEFVQLIDDAQVHVFGKRVEELMFSAKDGVFHRAVALARLDLHFRFAVSDYTAALGRPIDCAFLCNRAIEALKSAFGSEQSRSSWEAFHEALGTDQAQIRRVVKVFADPIRHGNWEELPETTSTQRFEMLRLTRDILMSYLDLKSPRT